MDYLSNPVSVPLWAVADKYASLVHQIFGSAQRRASCWPHELVNDSQILGMEGEIFQILEFTSLVSIHGSCPFGDASRPRRPFLCRTFRNNQYDYTVDLAYVRGRRPRPSAPPSTSENPRHAYRGAYLFPYYSFSIWVQHIVLSMRICLPTSWPSYCLHGWF